MNEGQVSDDKFGRRNGGYEREGRLADRLLDAAIKIKDGAAFDAAYKDVTSSCNNCHAGLDHAYIVVQEPSASPYTDQNLTGLSHGKAGKRQR